MYNGIPLEDYQKQLNVGVVFCSNKYGDNVVDESVIIENGKILLVRCCNNDVNALKPFTLVKVRYLGGFFVHESMGSFFEKEGAKRQYVLAQGLMWNGPNTFDDFC